MVILVLFVPQYAMVKRFALRVDSSYICRVEAISKDPRRMFLIGGQMVLRTEEPRKAGQATRRIED